MCSMETNVPNVGVSYQADFAHRKSLPDFVGMNQIKATDKCDFVQ